LELRSAIFLSLSTILAHCRLSDRQCWSIDGSFGNANFLKPATDKTSRRLFQWALAEGKTFEIVGPWIKARHRPRRAMDLSSDLSGLSG